MIKIFAGYDSREDVGFQVFMKSLMEHASVPFAIVPVNQKIFKRTARGTNRFGDLRFMIPKLMNYTGIAIWMDGSDMMLRGDIAAFYELINPFTAVQVVKHDYKTKSPRKYVGTIMESDNLDYPRKNWSSVMIMNCSHSSWRRISMDDPVTELHRFYNIQDEHIGDLPIEWNHLVGEYDFNPQARLVHFTLGIPGFSHYAHCDYASEWSAYQ